MVSWAEARSDASLRTVLVEQAFDLQGAAVPPEFPNLVLKPMPSPTLWGGPRGLQGFIGRNFSGAIKPLPGQRPHPPPPATAARLKLPPCTNVCGDCRYHGCLSCPGCCLSVDKDARSTSVLLLHQNARCPVNRSAFLEVGGQCFPVRKGLIVVLDSASTAHGVWANPLTDLTKHPWLSVEFVEH